MKKHEIEARLLPNGLPGDDQWPKERVGMLNVYVCRTCRAAVAVVLYDWGTTPFIIGCEEHARHWPNGDSRVRNTCTGDMTSRMYQVDPKWRAVATHAFFRPDDVEVYLEQQRPRLTAMLDRARTRQPVAGTTAELVQNVIDQTREHIEGGGLVLRELTPGEVVIQQQHARREFVANRARHGGA